MPTFPKLHNAAWPGLVGKEPDSANPPIPLETMLDYTANAEVDGQRFDGIDLFLFDPHVSIDASRDDLERLAEQVGYRNLVIGSVVAPVWEPTGGGSAMDPGAGRKAFLTQIEKACRIARDLREIGIRRYGVVRIDSATPPPTGPPTPKPAPKPSPRPSGRPPTSPPTTANASPPRARSAGPACIPGGRCSNSSKPSTGPARWGSRRTWPTPGST